MSEQLDFLTPGIGQIRHQIRNILESYNHDWDLIAELAQNSIDAIRLRSPRKGRLDLLIDAPQKQVVIRDNGCGISPNDLPNLLAPFSSDKTGQQHLIGEKGVGISFVIFSSSTFEIETHHETGSAKASIHNASGWVHGQSEELPKLGFERIDTKKDEGTKVSVTLPSEADFDFFNVSFEQLEMVVRTRTAVGNTESIWGDTPENEVYLTFVDLNGSKRSRKVKGSYFLPVTMLSQNQCISLDDFRQWNTLEKTDQQKRRQLRNKVVYLAGETFQAGRTIRHWACFVPNRKAWDVVSVNSRLVGKTYWI